MRNDKNWNSHYYLITWFRDIHCYTKVTWTHHWQVGEPSNWQKACLPENLAQWLTTEWMNQSVTQGKLSNLLKSFNEGISYSVRLIYQLCKIVLWASLPQRLWWQWRRYGCILSFFMQGLSMTGKSHRTYKFLYSIQAPSTRAPTLYDIYRFCYRGVFFKIMEPRFPVDSNITQMQIYTVWLAKEIRRLPVTSLSKWFTLHV